MNTFFAFNTRWLLRFDDGTVENVYKLRLFLFLLMWLNVL